MPLPEFNNSGDLPPGVHPAPIDEIIARFGSGSPQRQAVTARMGQIYALASATGHLQHFILFGSYVTEKPTPNDVDIVLVMRDTFNVSICDEQTTRLFDHQQATKEFGASVFWTRPSLLILETLDEFIAHWQIKRDRTRRGIVEVIP
jgi:Family of unknown function (DUF6932)